MKKIGFYIFLLLVCTTAAFYGTSQPAPVSQHNDTATYATWIHELTVLPITQTAQASESPTITLTPTPSIAPTSTVTPTFTATTDYLGLVSKFLTPFTPLPTQARDPNYRTPTPAPTDVDVLRKISVQKLPAGWTPTPPPYIESRYNGKMTPQAATRDWRITHIQAATDLLNFSNADQSFFISNVDTWSQMDGLVAAHWGTTWFLKNDFDGDGQPEWLVSIPAYSANFEVFCCQQMMVLFEKSGGLYRPVYYQVGGGHSVWWQLLHVADLNRDGSLEVVTSTTVCGSGCGYDLEIGAWNGQRWRVYDHIRPNMPSGVSFFDTDHNGTTEIVIQYTTIYKLLSSYPHRKVTKTYGWKNGQFRQLEAWVQPNVTPLAIVDDASRKLLAHQPKEVLRLAQPVMDKLPQQCELVESAIALEVMLAYAADNQPKAMQETLAKITQFCHTPENNGFIPAANFLWAAYQKTHDPLRSCQAMERFMQTIRQLKTSDGNLQFAFLINSQVAHRSYCLPGQYLYEP